MVFPVQRQRDFQPYPTNNSLIQPGINRVAGGNDIASKIQPFVTNSVGGLSKTLNNVQQVLGVVQSTAPIIQQYGPMVKNIPMMYRMMKAFREIDNTDENQTVMDSTDKHVIEGEGEGIHTIKTDEITSDPDNETQLNKRKNNGQSIPKLFI